MIQRSLFVQWPIYPRFIPHSNIPRLSGLLRKDKHARRHILLLLRLLRREGYQQGADLGSKGADHEDQSQQGIRLFEHEIGNRVRGGQVEILRGTSTTN